MLVKGGPGLRGTQCYKVKYDVLDSNDFKLIFVDQTISSDMTDEISWVTKAHYLWTNLETNHHKQIVES